ncbi:winged helix-turn-helix transcriptional regulator [Celeribacter indicus]|uniref:HxlR family transcriptional regulator n=1 Tax=Celeribacter indicus TaxID=1208324 RepID=A0A0B5DXJ4_9RHOB|nr:helix-turn-helix domain-containing protein [Celeribacter indicus]AJE45825.1 HxlR family transcriptional regulator [Celeribacter indicus]SDW61564.1 transcriptional regulator, HxlR family [Celeribacter indicus]
MKETEPVIRHTADCLRASRVLSSIAGKWSVLVIMLLREQPLRFSELKRGVDGISQRMLTLTLRNLERNGLVTRTVTPSIPPRVDYELTGLGHSLADPIQSVGLWAFRHLEKIEAAQAHYDARATAPSGPDGEN